MASTDAAVAEERQQRRQEKKDRKKQKPEGNEQGKVKTGVRGGGSTKLRGRPNDSSDVRMSKTLSWVLRHGSQSEGLAMRPDGYVRVKELLGIPKLRELSFESLQQIVKDDAKGRYSLTTEADPASGEAVWWIRANQGHSMKAIVLELEPILSPADIPTGIAVHGTTRKAWDIIREQGLSKMSRNHIHLAQGVPGSGVMSGMRNSSPILIFIDVQKALAAGIKFYLSANGVVLTEGDEKGYLRPEFFSRVETASNGQALPGWDRSEGVLDDSRNVTKAPAPALDGANASATTEPTMKVEAVQASPPRSEVGVQSLTESLQSTTV